MVDRPHQQAVATLISRVVAFFLLFLKKFSLGSFNTWRLFTRLIGSLLGCDLLPCYGLLPGYGLFIWLCPHYHAVASLTGCARFTMHWPPTMLWPL